MAVNEGVVSLFPVGRRVESPAAPAARPATAPTALLLPSLPIGNPNLLTPHPHILHKPAWLRLQSLRPPLTLSAEPSVVGSASPCPTCTRAATSGPRGNKAGQRAHCYRIAFLARAGSRSDPSVLHAHVALGADDAFSSVVLNIYWLTSAR